MLTTKLAYTFRTLFALVLILLSINSAHSEMPAEGYSFGIGPVQSATELAKRWVPFMQYLSEKSGVPLHFVTAKDITTFQQQLRENAYDFGLINPYHYIAFNKSGGYTAFAREKDSKSYGLLVVKKDGPINSVNQLSGKTIAFPSATAMVGTWIQMNMLNKKNINVSRQYVNSMDSVYRSVAKGLFPAGGGEIRTWGTIDAEVKSELRILWQSEAFPPFPFMFHPRVPKRIVAKVLSEMEKMESYPEGIALLKLVNLKGIERSNDADYDEMRKMNFKPVEDN